MLKFHFRPSFYYKIQSAETLHTALPEESTNLPTRHTDMNSIPRPPKRYWPGTAFTKNDQMQKNVLCTSRNTARDDENRQIGARLIPRYGLTPVHQKNLDK